MNAMNSLFGALPMPGSSGAATPPPEAALPALIPTGGSFDDDSWADVEAPASSTDGAASPVLHAVPTTSDVDFEAVVEEMRGYIADGDVYQVVPSRGFTIACPDALAAYHVLRHANPSPYMFYLAAPDFELFGASPESALLHSARTGRVAIRPIAGTRPRGLHPDGSVDHERDTRLELELRTDAKEVAEHVMLVDLARNDVARVSRPGTRSVQDLLRVDRYSRVMHLVSEVSGELADDLDALDAFRAAKSANDGAQTASRCRRRIRSTASAASPLRRSSVAWFAIFAETICWAMSSRPSALATCWRTR